MTQAPVAKHARAGEPAGDDGTVADPADQLRRRVDAIGWYHSIDLGHGVVTPGQSENVLPSDCLPDVAGRSVLDIGAWDGYYSFDAERRGAERVVALDHYMWGIDFDARSAYWDACAAAGELPDHERDMTDFWLPDLPGKRGFDLAHEVLGSKVEAVVADFASVDLAALGTFDVVLCLGVLYHMRDLLGYVQRLRRVTREVAVIETEAMEVAGLESYPLMSFHGDDRIGGDFGNWWVPDMVALRDLALAAGFARTEICQGPPADLAGATPVDAPEPDPALGLVPRSDWRLPPAPPVPALRHYRAAILAYC